MRRALPAVTLCFACAAAPPPPTARAPAPDVTPAPASDCPTDPTVELFAVRDGALREPFRAGGHITSLTPTRLDDDTSAWLSGELDVKGTRAFESHTHDLAAESYAATTRGAAPVAMALALRGRLVAALEVRSAMRGRRFLLRVPDDVAFDGGAVDELAAALREDRRCFAGR